jgi:glycosyltransferase involved in cell wall biosynthesis
VDQSPDNELQHSVDRIVVSGKRVFGWGWAAHRSRAVKGIDLYLEGEGWERRIPTGFGLARDDVEKAFPDHVNSGASGFVVAGHIPKAPARRSWLEVDFEEGPRTRIDVTALIDNRYSQRTRFRQIGWLAQSVWRRLRHGDLLGILRRATAQAYAVASMTDVSVIDEIVRTLRDSKRICVMFDHNMGGGANQYRRGVIAERVAAGEDVLLCTYNLPVLEYRLHLFRPGREEQVFRISTFVLLERVLEELAIAEIFVNSPVSFDEPLLLAEWLARMRIEHPEVRLTVTAHDYFSVCPSFVLLNADGRYCGIPDISVCSACLKRHPASHVALTPPTEIGPWRALWGRCLHTADEVRFFSESTREHFLRAYPTLPRERLTVVPHRSSYVPLRLPRVDPAAPLVIGVLGEISMQKGATILKEMVRLIDTANANVRIVVLGTLHAALKSPRLTVTGAYDRAHLVDLIEENGINMFLFPSIWPETFSYVVAELIALDMPVVAFDLGAPGERLAHYPKARMCGETSAPAALAALVAFHRELAVGPVSAVSN